MEPMPREGWMVGVGAVVDATSQTESSRGACGKWFLAWSSDPHRKPLSAFAMLTGLGKTCEKHVHMTGPECTSQQRWDESVGLVVWGAHRIQLQIMA